MTDMRDAIIPKSDQINADDLLTGPITITVRDVKITSGTEQPVSIYFTNDGGKPYKPCKSMSRCLVHAWGADASKYIGRSMTLYCDPTVKWGGMAVGGIRISHLSHINNEMLLALTATKGKKAPFIVKPLVIPTPSTEPAKNPPKTAENRATKLAKEPASAPVYELRDHFGNVLDMLVASRYLDAFMVATKACPTKEDLNSLITFNKETLDALPEDVKVSARTAFKMAMDVFSA